MCACVPVTTIRYECAITTHGLPAPSTPFFFLVVVVFADVCAVCGCLLTLSFSSCFTLLSKRVSKWTYLTCSLFSSLMLFLLQQKQTNKQTKETLPSKNVVLTVSETEKKKKKSKNCFSEVVHVFPYFFFFLSLHRLSCVAIECTCALSQLFQSNNTPAVERNASRCVYGWRRGHTRKKKK